MEDIKNIGLVLEGGGMRGLYTAGVLDFFMDNDLYFPYIIGTSAGACNATSYISRQRGRNKKINIKYIKDDRYISYRNLFREKSLLGMNFLFDEIPNKLEPFGFEEFNKAKETFLITCTDCNTGKAVYINKNKCNDILTAVRASSSLPFISPIVKYEGLSLLDGGVADSIPIKKSIEDGNEKNIIVLTRHREYVKEPFKRGWMARRIYSNYPGLVEAMQNRHKVYNETLECIKQLEKENKAIVICPEQPLNVDRLEKDEIKLVNLYDQGYKDAEKKYKDIVELIVE